MSTISLCAATSSRVCGLYFSTHGASSFPSTIMGAFPFADMLDRAVLHRQMLHHRYIIFTDISVYCFTLRHP